MANPEHLKILKQGIVAWNAWREEHQSEPIGLSRANLSGANLSGADLSGADLSGTDLSDSILIGANLIHANLIHANLGYSNLSGANLSGADLNDADLYCTNLYCTNLTSAKLEKTKMNEAYIGRTIFGDVDLMEVIGLDTVIQRSPSTVGIDTLYKSKGEITDKFLQDAGMPEGAIELARSIRAGPAIQWHSCFISYSTKDEEFARHLYSRMRKANMRVWFAPEDMKGGDYFSEQIDRAIQLQDRLLLVLSKDSIKSKWVEREIRRARKVERMEKRRKLFPITLMGYTALKKWECPDSDTGEDLAEEVRKYHIPDFSNWKNHDAFESAFARLKKDLEAENSKES